MNAERIEPDRNMASAIIRFSSGKAAQSRFCSAGYQYDILKFRRGSPGNTKAVQASGDVAAPGCGPVA